MPVVGAIAVTGYLGGRRFSSCRSLQVKQQRKHSVATSGPGSVVGIATGYGLDGAGIESRWGRDFPHLSRPTLRPTQPPVQWVPGLSWG